MRIHYLQHVPFENPGSILDWAEAHHHSVTRTRLYLNEALPRLAEFDWLIVMGGPMNIYEEEKFPWLHAEKELIRQSIAAGRVIIGLCLGGQLIADVIGGRVTKNPQPEIGWLPVTFTPQARGMRLFSFFPQPTTVFLWHGDTFGALPKEALCVAKSEGCENQAFIYQNRVFGFQFHLENTAGIIADLTENCADELVPGPYVQTPAELQAHADYVGQCNALMNRFLTELEQAEKEGAL